MLRRLIWVFLPLAGALLASNSSIADSGPFSAKCVGVTDGDTITVLRDNSPIEIRLEGIDAPESGDDYSTKAKEFVSALVFGKPVTVHAKGPDRYGRTVARVVVDGIDVSLALVRAGLAWHYTKYSDDPELTAAEQVARAAQINIWSLPNPLPPWEQREIRSNAPNRDPPATPAIVYHGNRRSKVFHAPWCRYYNCKNCTVRFHSREEALAAGYRPGGHCRP